MDVKDPAVKHCVKKGFWHFTKSAKKQGKGKPAKMFEPAREGERLARFLFSKDALLPNMDDLLVR